MHDGTHAIETLRLWATEDPGNINILPAIVYIEDYGTPSSMMIDESGHVVIEWQNANGKLIHSVTVADGKVEVDYNREPKP